MNKAKILVADDIKQNVKLLRVILTASEYDVIEAYDGEEALEKAKTENPDLILLDIMMPRLTGYEVCQKLRADGTTKNIPIVMITALHEMDDRIKGIEAGADDFISKPFNKAELLARVKSLLRMRQPSVKRDETPVLDTILSGLSEGVIVADEQWKIKNINQTAQELLHIQTDTKDMDLMAHLSRMRLSVPMETLRNSQEKDTDFQILSSNTQHPFHANARMTKIFDNHGNITGITLIVRREGNK
ncbi:MAG: response regulator [Candidatus Brocadia sinica]|nr:response regulator [Candidatus Brocadia sinica]NUO04481.1 response regulator [Candidatus Brocadia sinica]